MCVYSVRALWQRQMQIWLCSASVVVSEFGTIKTEVDCLNCTLGCLECARSGTIKAFSLDKHPQARWHESCTRQFWFRMEYRAHYGVMYVESMPMSHSVPNKNAFPRQSTSTSTYILYCSCYSPICRSHFNPPFYYSPISPLVLHYGCVVQGRSR